MPHDGRVADAGVQEVDEGSVNRLCEEYVRNVAALDPVLATHTGLVGHDASLTDLSPDGWEAREECSRRAWTAVEAAVPADAQEALARSAFLERLSSERDLVDAGLLRGEVNVVSTSLHRLRGVFDLMPTDGEEAWANIDAPLAEVPAALEGYRATLRDEAAHGRVAARRQYVEVAAQVQAWADAHEGAGLFGDLVSSADVGFPLYRCLGQHASAATEALAVTARFLAEEMAPLGRQRDAVGRNHYALASRHFLGSTIDLDDTYAWGWEELHRISAEMGRTAREILPGAAGSDEVAVADAVRSQRIRRRRYRR